MKETIDLLGKIITNILTALYEPFGFSLLLSFLVMFFYLYTSTISVRIPTRNTVSYADDDLVVVAKSCYCFDSNRDMIIKVR